MSGNKTDEQNRIEEQERLRRENQRQRKRKREEDELAQRERDKHAEAALARENDFFAELDPKDHDAIVDAYIKEFGPQSNEKEYSLGYSEPTKDPKTNRVVLRFPGYEAAKKFFEQLAASRTLFLTLEQGKGFDGRNFLSCGTGALYTGTLTDIHKNLLLALKEPGLDKVNQEKLQTGISHLEKLQPSLAQRRIKDELQDGNEYTAPSPTQAPGSSKG